MATSVHTITSQQQGARLENPEIGGNFPLDSNVIAGEL